MPEPSSDKPHSNSSADEYLINVKGAVFQRFTAMSTEHGRTKTIDRLRVTSYGMTTAAAESFDVASNQIKFICDESR